MANNVHEPCFPSPPDNRSMGNNSANLTTIYWGSNIVGFSNDHSSFANINISNKLLPLLPQPFPPILSPLQPPILTIPSESDVPSEEQNRKMEPQHVVVALTKRPRGRGRPPGSKNKPKPIVEFPNPSPYILRERKDFLKPIILVIPAGMNIVNAIIDFGRDRDVSISVHHASGAISEAFTPKAFHLHPLITHGKTPQVFGGLVGRKLITAEPVQVMASIIKKHKYHKWMNPISNANVQSIIKSTQANHCATIMSNALSDITNNTVNHTGFSIRDSTLSSMNVQPFATPTNVNMVHCNNPTNQDFRFLNPKDFDGSIKTLLVEGYLLYQRIC
ncbi:AT-hook motif nuclear-localized protein 17, partial [Mucuna pruriens]